MTSTVVRLVGDDAEIARVVSRARTLILMAGKDGWTDRVVDLARMRAEVLRRLAQTGVQPRSAPLADASGRSTGWWIAFLVGVVAAFVGSAVMLPPKGRGSQDPVLMMAIAQPAIVLGAVLLLLLALLPLPRGVRGSRSAIGLTVVVGLFAILAGVLTAVRWSALLDVAGATSVAVWMGAAIVLLVASVVLVLRARGAARERPAPRGGADTGVSEARRLAQRLARELPYDLARPGEVERAWAQELDGIATGIDASVRDQARQLGPYAYTVWAYYDGELELPRVETLRTR